MFRQDIIRRLDNFTTSGSLRLVRALRSADGTLSNRSEGDAIIRFNGELRASSDGDGVSRGERLLIAGLLGGGYVAAVLLSSGFQMSLIAAVVLVQKLVADQRVVDVPLALALVALGILIVGSPALVPGLNPRM